MKSPDEPYRRYPCQWCTYTHIEIYPEHNRFCFLSLLHRLGHARLVCLKWPRWLSRSCCKQTSLRSRVPFISGWNLCHALSCSTTSSVGKRVERTVFAMFGWSYDSVRSAHEPCTWQVKFGRKVWLCVAPSVLLVYIGIWNQACLSIVLTHITIYKLVCAYRPIFREHQVSTPFLGDWPWNWGHVFHKRIQTRCLMGFLVLFCIFSRQVFFLFLNDWVLRDLICFQRTKHKNTTHSSTSWQGFFIEQQVCKQSGLFPNTCMDILPYVR